jgi:hypothetical protein
MITLDHPLLQLLALIDLMWVETSPPSGKVYSDQSMFKIYMVSVLKQMWNCRSLWRYLTGMPLVLAACRLAQIPDRRMLDRRLAEIVPQAEAQIQALGLVLSLEVVSDATVAASDGSAFATPGPVWHKQAKATGLVPAGLRGLDTQAEWIQSTYHGWGYSYKAHVTITVAPTTMRVVLNATVTGSASESNVLQAWIETLPPLVRWLLLDAGYDDADLIADCAQRGFRSWLPCLNRLASRPPKFVGVVLPIWGCPKAKRVASSAGTALNSSLPPLKHSFISTLSPFKEKCLPPSPSF